MKRVIFVWLLLFVLISFFTVKVCYAKTLVKYYKTTGDIIQTNSVDEMPSQEILSDRFKSVDTDVILVDSAVDISTQRVDLNKKKLIAIPEKELSDAKKVIDKKALEEKLINDKMREQAIAALKAEGKLDANGKIKK